MARPHLAKGKVRFVGDIVAVVIATTAGEALDAAETVFPDIDPLPAVTGIEEAYADDAPLLFDEVGSNLVAGAGTGDVEGIFDDADVVVEGKFLNQRLAGVPMEPNACVAEPGAPEGGVTLWLSTQTPHGARDAIAGDLGLDGELVRVVAPRVGGGFGPKATAYPEYTIAAKAAMVLGRPVRWNETRSENMLSMVHGRSQVQWVELGVKRDGTIVGLRATVIGDAGAYPAVGTILPSLTQLMAQGVYDIPAIDFTWKSVATNTTTCGAYRGAGRPEATQLLERIMDMAADELGMDPARAAPASNYLQPDRYPMTSLTGAEYDNGRAREGARRGQAGGGLRRAARRAEAASRRGRAGRAGHRRRLLRRGDRAAGPPRRVRLGPRPTPTARSPSWPGPARTGRATRPSFAQSRLLGPRRADGQDQGRAVRHRAGAQRGRHAGLAVAPDGRAAAIRNATQELVSRAREIAAHLLEASVEDIEHSDDGFGVRGVAGSSVTWSQIAAASEDGSGLDDGNGRALREDLDFKQGQSSFPFGSHIAVVEVDLDTGMVTPRRHVAVDDCGKILNPMLVAGQQHGGSRRASRRPSSSGSPSTRTATRRRATWRPTRIPSAADLCRSRRRTPRRRPSSTPSGRRASGSRGRSGPRRRCTTRSSTRSPTSACGTSTCR